MKEGMLSVFKNVTSLEKNFLNGLGNLPPSTYTTYPNSHFPRNPSKPIQRWKPLL
ncbi:hypothetical protein CFP56_018049 [Quercus suber]|uniref:Uncharacterized protein n=1 Tax=Quercus suber TaxID=58331 RepID=A0AAW0KL18_QUESU